MSLETNELPEPKILFYALTERQQELVRLLGQEELTLGKHLASALAIRPSTVKNMIVDIYNRVERMGFRRPGSKIELLEAMFEWPERLEAE